MWIQDRHNIKYLDDILLEGVYRGTHPHRLPKPVPASALEGIPLEHIRQWCIERANYQIVTEELINWLAERIKGKKAIEICAGHGTIGRHLGIPMTDSYMQTLPDLRVYYALLNQAIIEPPPDVERMEASDAVREHSPEVVIASWATQFAPEEFINTTGKGSTFGVKEIEILQTGVVYIHVGNDETHGYKDLMSIPHETHRYPWLIARALNPSVNHLCLWKGPAHATT
jgi:hypothetical protein